jgi:hypothetical protein
MLKTGARKFWPGKISKIVIELIGFRWLNKGRDHSGELGVDERIILKHL